MMREILQDKLRVNGGMLLDVSIIQYDFNKYNKCKHLLYGE